MTAAVKGGGSPPPPDGLLCAKQAADYLGISLKRLYAFVNDGSLRHLRLADTKAGVLRFRRAWLDAWAEAKASGGNASGAVAVPANTDNPKRRFWLTAFDDEILWRLVTADAIEPLIVAAMTRPEQRLFIYDTHGGFLIVWAGTPEDARNAKWLTRCAGCQHLGVEHWSERTRARLGRCRQDGCTCREFRR